MSDPDPLLAPVTLSGDHVVLEPLRMDHVEALCLVGLSEELWKYTPGMIRSEQGMREYVSDALEQQDQHRALPFVIIHRNSGKVVGSSRYGNIDLANGRVEIGWTWIGREWQRTAVNTEMKLLMLTHAFEFLKCVRVEFKTDVLNSRSRMALGRIGAVEEGTLRRHMKMHDARYRDTVYYSILDKEWPRVRSRLGKMMRDRE